MDPAAAATPTKALGSREEEDDGNDDPPPPSSAELQQRSEGKISLSPTSPALTSHWGIFTVSCFLYRLGFVCVCV